MSNVGFGTTLQTAEHKWKVAANMRDYCFFLSNGHIAVIRKQISEDLFRCDLIRRYKTGKLFSEPCDSSLLTSYSTELNMFIPFQSTVIDTHWYTKLYDCEGSMGLQLSLWLLALKTFDR